MGDVELFVLLGLAGTAVFSTVTFGMARRGQRAAAQIEEARERIVEGLKELVRDGIVPDRDSAAMLIVAAASRHRVPDFEIGSPEAMLCRLFDEINSDPLVGPQLKRAIVPQLAETMNGRRPDLWRPDFDGGTPALTAATRIPDELP